MNIPTCYGCPERHKNGKRCDILAEKTKAVRGLGLTVIKFKCERREKLFSAGDVVEFDLSKYDDGCRKLQGIVMRPSDRKPLVYSEDTNHRVCRFWPDELTKTGDHEVVCVHCGMPQSAMRPVFVGSYKTDTEKEWECRFPTFEQINAGYDDMPLPCEYPPDPRQQP